MKPNLNLIENAEFTRLSQLIVIALKTWLRQYMKKFSAGIAQDKFMLTLGGEHAVSIGAIKAYAQNFPQISLLQLDAHSDQRENYEGSTLNHACVIARAKDWINTIVAVGIRSMDFSERSNVEKTKVFYAHEIAENRNWIDPALDSLHKQVLFDYRPGRI